MSMSNGKEILVIDDDPGICALIVDVAESMGCFPQSAAEKDDILHKIQSPWDCILVDLTMPDIDGIEVLRLLSEQDNKCPVILISGFAAGVLDSARNLGEARGLTIIEALTKPIQIDTLEKTIELALATNLAQPKKRQKKADADHNLFEANVDHGGVIPYYQPKIDARTGCLVGYEALARWWHPQKGLLSPAAFIPQAIANGHINALTMSMIECIAVDMTNWATSNCNKPVAINIEATSLSDLDFPGIVEAALRENGILTENIILEITESGIYSHAANALDNLIRFRVKGFKLSIDDFGTGHSTLSQLHKMPFNQLKVDKMFVDGIGVSKQSEAIVISTIDLAHRLELEVVAEGVESEPQIEFLRHHGCDQLQGYYFAKPMNAADVCLWRGQSADPIYSAA